MDTLEFDVDDAILKVRKFLPIQGPIKDFIHLNILEKFMDLPFHDAVVEAGNIFNANSYMPLSYYREKYKKNEISDKNILDTIDQEYPDISNDDKDILIKKLHEYKLSRPNIKNSLFIRNSLFKKIGVNLDHIVNPILFRLLGSYLDQGVALWHYLDRKSFLNAILLLSNKSSIPIAYFINNKELYLSLKENINSKTIEILKYLLADEKFYFEYIKESLISHRGWSGMVDIVERKKKSLSQECNISLKEFFFVKLIFEMQAIKYFKPKFLPLAHEEIIYDDDKDPSLIKLLKIWHEALEKNYYEKVAKLLKDHKIENKNKPKYQAIFCIDDRECGFRRILEQESNEIETFSTAGFFGIDAYLILQKKGIQEKICPVPIDPNHVILERPFEDGIKKSKAISSDFLSITNFLIRHGANSFWMGFFAIHTLGHLSLFGLLTSFSHPKRLLFSKKQRNILPENQIIFMRDEKNPKINQNYLGYTISEMADRVFNTLKGIDLVDGFASLIFFVGHGSSSLNNPHFAAYDCGACSGRPGRVSARVICGMANLKSVREILKERFINIPDTTRFIPVYHDTCTDEIDFHDIKDLNEEQLNLLNEFKTYISSTQKKNAFERCKRFVLAKNINLNNALLEVKHRSQALFEPRPELGHQQNALLIVGRRKRTYMLNLNRRAFLQSYNPLTDPDGNILLSLLSAAIPVCGGINLDYFFSRLDQAVYGSGSKLSHNVTCLLGVGHGLDDDLRTGLPIQMTELHDPIRLLVIVEQEPKMLLDVIKRNPQVFLWVKNSWVKLACLMPHKNEILLFDGKENFTPILFGNSL